VGFDRRRHASRWRRRRLVPRSAGDQDRSNDIRHQGTRLCFARQSVVNTDEGRWYGQLGAHFMSHDAVNHSTKEYVRGEITTNTVEGYYSIFKRGMKGVYQHWR
jgi:ISXO2 transposase-like protein